MFPERKDIEGKIRRSVWYATAESNGSRLCTIDPRSAPNARIIERDGSLGARKKRRGVAE